MTKLKELSVSELHQRIKDATDELIAREIEEVKPLKTEKRVAEVGEKVVITNPSRRNEAYKGEVYTVSHSRRGSVGVDVEEIEVTNNYWAFYHKEYEVLVEEKPIKPKSANQQRAELIQRAREFVGKYSPIVRLGDSTLTDRVGDVSIEFVVNEGKRTVVVIPRRLYLTNSVVKESIGIAKCHPDDVFNADIGKAIALARALEIEVPEEFLDAIQPTEKVIGMLIRNTERLQHNPIGTVKQLVRRSDYRPNVHNAVLNSVFDNSSVIIDDTNAEYAT